MYLKNLTREKFSRAFPKIALVIFLHVFCYYIPLYFTKGDCFFAKLPLDDKIPFLNGFALFYVLAYLQWGLYWLFLAAEGEPMLTKYIRTEVLGKALGMVIFIFYPVTMEQPADTGAGLFGWIVSVIYALDRPVCLFPSMHCFLAWIWFRAVLESENTTRPVKLFTGMMAVCICASTVFIKQHLIADVFAGVLLCELCLLISKHLPTRWKRKENPPPAGA